MTFFTRRSFIALGGVWLATPALAGKPAWSMSSNDVASDGADVVAYFGLPENAEAVRGKRALTAKWQGALWRFSTKENLRLFAQNPMKYAPQFGGYCSLAVANGGTAPGGRDAWHIHNGQLYLNYDKSVRQRWRRDISDNIRRAELNWPGVLA